MVVSKICERDRKCFDLFRLKILARMSNPAVANMVPFPANFVDVYAHVTCPQMNRMQSGGGLPDMSDLMQDPNLRNLYVPRLFVSV